MKDGGFEVIVARTVSSSVVITPKGSHVIKLPRKTCT